MQPHDHHDGNDRSSVSASTLVLVGFLAIAGFYLVTEHSAHLYGILPWLLLLACPLMHLFMHHGHGGHRHRGGGERPTSEDGNAR
jgi:hypothetical protein